MRLKVVLEPSDEPGYVAYAPSLPGCTSEEETVEEAPGQHPTSHRALSQAD